MVLQQAYVGTTSSTIFPMWVLDSIRACASDAFDNGRTVSTSTLIFYREKVARLLLIAREQFLLFVLSFEDVR